MSKQLSTTGIDSTAAPKHVALRKKSAQLLLMRWLAALLFTASALSGEITTSSTNGDAVVTWNGTVVWQGKTANPLRAATVTADGKDHAAAFDGAKTVWESEPGSGAIVRAKSPELKAEPIPPKGPVAGRGISTRIVNGETIIHWQKKEVWRGTTSGFLTCKSKALNGVEIAAAFDSGKMIWESEPGAAERVK